MATRHEPDVLFSTAHQVARELGTRLVELGLTETDAVSIARAAARDAVVFTEVGYGQTTSPIGA